MSGSPKPLGSLSSSLLARKGQARPAMRSQGFGGMVAVPQGADDLGWNDMGEAVPAAAPVEAVRVETVPVQADAQPQPVAETAPIARDVPPVLVEREALAAAVTTPPVVKTVSVPTATRLQRETQHAGKAAFTLRVDADRHLRLRLASAITNRSAQELVTLALDALIQSMPEVDALVAQLPAAKGKR